VLAGEEAGSKLTKAQELGVKILDVAEFKNWLQANKPDNMKQYENPVSEFFSPTASGNFPGAGIRRNRCPGRFGCGSV
jgi:hypothetical protein